MTILQRAAALVAGAGVAAALGAQTSKPAPAPESTAVGHQLFKTYCASCHGENGHGNGPAAESLRHLPPDLSRYAAKNGGVFPDERLGRIIDGRDVPSHGSREMPVWGDAFRVIEGGATPEAIKARIAAILKYLEMIQARNGN